MIKNLIEYTVRSLVSNPAAVSVREVKGVGDTILFEIGVDSADRGKVIGKEGQTIKALRSFVGLVNQSDRKVTVDIVAD